MRKFSVRGTIECTAKMDYFSLESALSQFGSAHNTCCCTSRIKNSQIQFRNWFRCRYFVAQGMAGRQL